MSVTLKVGDPVWFVGSWFQGPIIGTLGEVVAVDESDDTVLVRFNGWTGGHSGEPLYHDSTPENESSHFWLYESHLEIVNVE